MSILITVKIESPHDDTFSRKMIHKIARKHFIYVYIIYYGRFRKLMNIIAGDQLGMGGGGGSSSLRVYLDTFILTYWTLLAFGWARRVNRVKVTRGCAMAWRPGLSIGLSVCPSACLPVRLLVCSLSVCLSHCALRTVPHTACGIFFFRVRFSSVFRCRQSVRKRRAVWSFFGSLCIQFGIGFFRSHRQFFLLLRFLLLARFRLGRPLAYRTKSFLAGGKLCAPSMWVCAYVCVCISVCSKWKSASTAQLKKNLIYF